MVHLKRRRAEYQKHWAYRKGLYKPLGQTDCVICGDEFRKRAHNQRACSSCKAELARLAKNASSRRCRARRSQPLHCIVCGQQCRRMASGQKTCENCRPIWASQKSREWQLANVDRVKEIRRRAYQKRRKCPSKRLYENFSTKVSRSLRTKRSASWEGHVGYTIEDLIRHLERQFYHGMSWQNYGSWHVDHILPVACFSFRNVRDPEFTECWALTNLRPAWARENQQKNDKRLHLL